MPPSAFSNGAMNFSKIPAVLEIPYLLETQKKSYEEFLQYDLPPDERQNVGLQEAFRNIFPIETGNPEKPSTLEFVDYSFGTPKYSPQECIDRGMTYAAPLKLRLQLIVRERNEQTGECEIKDIKEQEIYIGDIPLMTERGTFVINGAERVIVSQLHRSPGVSFSSTVHPNGKINYQARLIPNRGAWVEFEIDIYNVMWVMVDRKRKIPATTFLRALGNLNEEQIAAAFFPIQKVSIDDFSRGRTKVANMDKHLGAEIMEDVLDANGKIVHERGMKVTKKTISLLKDAGVKEVMLDVAEGYEHVLNRIIARDVVDKRTGEVLAEVWDRVTTPMLRRFAECKITSIDVISDEEGGNVILHTLEKDRYRTYEESVVEVFKRVRPGNPPSVAAGKRLIAETFLSDKRYDLGNVGRFKINRRFGTENETTRLLTTQDIINTMRYLIDLQKKHVDVDDIDHLGNRRVRSVGELLQNQIRAGLLELERTARERMSVIEMENLLPQNLINHKPLMNVIKEFFGRSQLSQFMDQTNPLAELTHKRRLSALGPGGLSRERAGFEVRDVHHTHYGRICPIETPEGPNIGLINSLSTYARINPLGFIETPYRKVRNGRVTDEIEFLTADLEDNYHIAQANAPLDENGRFVRNQVLSRYRGDFLLLKPEEVDYMDISPKQLVSVSAALIPFLEHDDANRALMGSNMQRQAVPLVFPEQPLVATGIEERVAKDSGVCVVSRSAGTVTEVASDHIVIRTAKGADEYYELQKFRRSNQNTCINQRPIVREGEKVQKGQIIADGPGIHLGQLALGRNVLVAFMPWGGYNFEDAILLSEDLVKDDVFTSIHIEEFETDARDTKLGKEEITRDIPNVGEEMLSRLDADGLIYIGSEVKPGDILVGKVTPKGETELTSEERLLRAIFGEKAGDVKDASLRVPPGVNGVVVDIKVFSRKEKGQKTDKYEKAATEKIERERDQAIQTLSRQFDEQLTELLAEVKHDIMNYETGRSVYKPGEKVTDKVIEYIRYSLETGMLPIEGPVATRIKAAWHNYRRAEQAENDQAKTKIDSIKSGDELPPGVLKMVKVYVAVKRKIAVGDKMAGRHGNKGVIAKILPVEDMPFLPDGTPVQIVLNPLGVPSRMNVGQILETHLGWAARALNMQMVTPVFDGAKEHQIKDLLKKAGLPESGESLLFDGLTGEPFAEHVTVGYIYMMKLNHLVDDKMHARAIGPYSLVTQQPLGGKAQFGGQRFGEMEVWALEAYGAAYALQEILTVKSDDVTGRSKMYESIVKGHNFLKPGIPESFNVLVKELQALALNMELLVEEEVEPVVEPQEAAEEEVALEEAFDLDFLEEDEEELVPDDFDEL
ncbi:MAG: DNA-directed RNA polymerase subunit beta [Candidatus Sumerlaeia bacterium]